MYMDIRVLIHAIHAHTHTHTYADEDDAAATGSQTVVDATLRSTAILSRSLSHDLRRVALQSGPNRRFTVHDSRSSRFDYFAISPYFRFFVNIPYYTSSA